MSYAIRQYSLISNKTRPSNINAMLSGLVQSSRELFYPTQVPQHDKHPGCPCGTKPILKEDSNKR